MSHSTMSTKQLSKTLVDALIRVGLLAALVIFSFQVFHPFLDLMLWATILAVTLYPLHLFVQRKTGMSDGRSATLIVVLPVLLLAMPAYLLASSLTDSVQEALAMIKSGNVHVPPPPDAVADWPLVGKKLHGFWLQAATDLTGLVQKVLPHVREASLGMLGKLAGMGLGLLVFFAALLIAGIIMAFGASGSRAAVEIASRLFGTARGQHVADLCTATIRAVAQGVVGIAFIQMLLVGLGFAIKGVPGTGVLALAVLLLGIVQLPATLITVPVIAYVFYSEGASTATVVFAVYVFVAGLIDNVLKPLLLGRGVDVPMPVVLIGALGGMVTNGIIGLFIGPVVLAVAYELFWQWVRAPEPEADLPVPDQAPLPLPLPPSA